MNARHLSVFAICLLMVPVSGRAADWPQWRGPDRAGTSKETGLLKQWPKDGPKQVWKATDIGKGYSTPSVVGDRIYLLSNRDNDEFAMALDVKTGKEVWSERIGKVGKNRMIQYPGARSTPTVEGEVLYALSSDGDLVCLETAKGKLRWKKHLQTDFGGKHGNWAYSESPLIDGDILVCSPGGEKATIVALKKKTGDTVWKCAVPGGDEAGYASAIAVEVGGVRQYVQFLGKGLVGVDATTGKFLWRYDKTKDMAANIPTPVFYDGCVFTSTSRNGSGLNRIKVAKDAVESEQVYFNTTKLNSIGGVVRVGDHLYGTDAGGELTCMEFKSGKVKWHKPSVGTASVCYADGMLYVRGQGGTGFGKESPTRVALVEATPEGYKEYGRFEQPDHGNRPAWPPPVVANGRLYLRDQGVLFCYDIKAPK
jgi:outer membrane protein assembly factor BamB